MSQVLVPVAFGELLDKITILEIKSERIADPAKLKNVRRELELLNETWSAAEQSAQDVSDLKQKLKAVNEALWEIEDRIRIKESKGEFDDEFVQLARSVYFRNDERSVHKRAINERLGSEIVEEKSYADYRREGQETP